MGGDILMQNFIDSVTGKAWAFEADVVVMDTNGVYSFKTAAGVPLNVPTTLVPGLPPAPSAAQIAAQMGQIAYGAAIAAGCQIVSTGTPALNGTYPIDDSTLIKAMGEQNYIALKGTFTNGQTTRAWLDVSGAPHVFPTTAEFTAFGEALAQYIDALQTALAVSLAGGAWVAPEQPAPLS
jgi:hypothetical protein